MYASILAVIGVAMYDTGGVLEIWKIANKYGRIDFKKYILHFLYIFVSNFNHTWENTGFQKCKK